MKMASFNNQYIFNSSSHNNTINDEFDDFKPFSSSKSNTLGVETHYQHHRPNSSHELISKHFMNDPNWSSKAAPEYLNDQKASSAFSSGPQLISFANSSLPEPADMLLDDEMVCNIRARTTTRNPMQAQYHVVSERKRRERLTQLFISLSKLVPGLTKLDKGSLLGDAIKYMKELQERVKTLEEEANRNSILESDAFETRSNISTTCGNDICFIKDNFNGAAIPDIKIKISNRNLLIKINCQKKHNGIIARIQSEMENMNLTIMDIRVIPFGGTTLDITLLAQMDRELSTTTTINDIIKHLETAILSPQYETLNYNIYSEDYFHHLSPLSGWI